MKLVELILKLDLEINIEILKPTMQGWGEYNTIFIGKIREIDFEDFFKWRSNNYYNTEIIDNRLIIYTH